MIRLKFEIVLDLPMMSASDWEARQQAQQKALDALGEESVPTGMVPEWDAADAFAKIMGANGWEEMALDVAPSDRKTAEEYNDQLHGLVDLFEASDDLDERTNALVRLDRVTANVFLSTLIDARIETESRLRLAELAVDRFALFGEMLATASERDIAAEAFRVVTLLYSVTEGSFAEVAHYLAEELDHIREPIAVPVSSLRLVTEDFGDRPELPSIEEPSAGLTAKQQRGADRLRAIIQDFRDGALDKSIELETFDVAAIKKAAGVCSDDSIVALVALITGEFMRRFLRKDNHEHERVRVVMQSIVDAAKQGRKH